LFQVIASPLYLVSKSASRTVQRWGKKGGPWRKEAPL
jgi:hypothetical protein